MKLPYSLLPTTLAIGFLFSSATEAPAFGGPPGGPFGPGSYFPNDGTFSAVVRGENLTGTLQFSTTQGAGPTPSSVSQSGNTTITTSGLGGVGSTGVATIYFDGDTYMGNSQGALNGQASTMTVNFQAGVQGQGQGNITVSQTTTNAITGNTTTIPVRTVNYFDSFYLNGFANCKTSNAFPNQKFEGSGEAEFQQLVFTGNTPFLDAVTLPISITGVRLSDTATSFNVSNVRAPSVTEFSVLVP